MVFDLSESITLRLAFIPHRVEEEKETFCAGCKHFELLKVEISDTRLQSWRLSLEVRLSETDAAGVHARRVNY